MDWRTLPTVMKIMPPSTSVTSVKMRRARRRKVLRSEICTGRDMPRTWPRKRLKRSVPKWPRPRPYSLSASRTEILVPRAMGHSAARIGIRMPTKI